MKILRPSEFKESIMQPHIYFRMYFSRAGRYLEDFKILGFISSFLLAFISLVYIFRPQNREEFLKIFIALAVFSLYHFISFRLFILWKKDFLQLHFIKWIYTNRATFISSFFLFIVLMSHLPKNIKVNILIFNVLLFYFSYFRAIIKYSKELSLKPYYIILYLCTTEILPVTAIISYIILFV